jgi:hypothetical protein
MLEHCAGVVNYEAFSDYIFWKVEIDLISISEGVEYSQVAVKEGHNYTVMAFSFKEEITDLRIELRDADDNIVAREDPERSGDANDNLFASIFDYESQADEELWVNIYADEFARGELQGHYGLLVMSKPNLEFSFSAIKYTDHQYKYKKREDSYDYVKELDTEYEKSRFEISLEDNIIYHVVGNIIYNYIITDIENNESDVSILVKDPYGKSFLFIFYEDINEIRLFNYEKEIMRIYEIE